MPRFVILICLIGGINVFVLINCVSQEFPLVSIRSLAVDSILLKYHNSRAIDTISYNPLLNINNIIIIHREIEGLA